LLNNFKLKNTNMPLQWSFLSKCAQNLGFVAVGVAPIGPVNKIAARKYEKWINSGFHSNMTYLEQNNDQRKNPSHPKILENANTIVVVALPYGKGHQLNGFWKYVASHARGRDYHKTMKKLLKKLAFCIREHFPKCNYRIFVDSAPVMERTWAVNAGIGSLAKNGALVVDDIGPRVILGEIICSNVPTPPPVKHPPLFNICKNCTLCIDACPTKALESPAVINCNRCLSYWTIERGDTPFPKDISSNNKMIFGCDICTSICPLNNYDHSSLELPPFCQDNVPELKDLLKMKDDELFDLLAGTPLLRAKIKVIRQNIELVLKNEER